MESETGVAMKLLAGILIFLSWLFLLGLVLVIDAGRRLFQGMR